MKKWQRYIFLLLFLPLPAWCQELSVSNFYPDSEDLSAVKEQVLDHNNKPCALIKVRLPYYQLFFEGDVIYTEYKGDNEYWVYMASGATWLQIKSPVASPLTFEFDYAVIGLSTYIMQLQYTLSGAYRTTLTSTQELRTTSFQMDKNSENQDPLNALVKVRLESYALTFSDDSNINKVIPKWNEYWVYMRPNASRLEILSSIAPPLTCNFEKKLKKGNTYILKLELKEPVPLPKTKEHPETSKTSTTTTKPYHTTTSKKTDDGMENFIGILYGTASNANSKEYGIRYGQINNNFSGFIGEVTFATSIPGHKFGDDKDTLISNSANLHVNAGYIWGYNNIALTLSAGSALCMNGCFGLNIGSGLIGRLGNVLLTFDYELSYYMGDVSDIWAEPGHYFKFGIGYTF